MAGKSELIPHFRARFGKGWSRAIAVGVIGLTIFACSSATSSTPSPSATEGASLSPSPTPILSPTPRSSADLTVTVAPSYQPTPNGSSATPTPDSSPSPLPSLGLIPSGNPTAIRWFVVSNPQIVAPMPSLGTDNQSYLNLYGWSGGYLGFENTYGFLSDGGDISQIDASYSADGLHWVPNGQLDAGSLTGVGVTDVVEGPAGLLAAGRHMGAACGGIPSVEALWLSRNGVSWRLIDATAVFGGGYVGTIDAGSAGYIATGTLKDSNTGAVWTSSDGVAWKSVDLSAKTFKGALVQDATAFSGGYVLAGSALLPDAGGCGGVPAMTPSLWWSKDGQAWSRDTVGGAESGTDAWMNVSRISDHALAATQWTVIGDVTTTSSWTSTDGRAWKPMSTDIAGSALLTNGRVGLLVGWPDADGHRTVSAFRDDLSLIELSQLGDVPGPEDQGTSMAFGPMGLVVANTDGSRLWVGVPVAG